VPAVKCQIDFRIDCQPQAPTPPLNFRGSSARPAGGSQAKTIQVAGSVEQGEGDDVRDAQSAIINMPNRTVFRNYNQRQLLIDYCGVGTILKNGKQRKNPTREPPLKT
jgi:hypothetical protein